jgi:hypothetical protein
MSATFTTVFITKRRAAQNHSTSGVKVRKFANVADRAGNVALTPLGKFRLAEIEFALQFAQ